MADEKPFVYHTEREPLHDEMIRTYKKVFTLVNDESLDSREHKVVAVIAATSAILVDEKLMKRFPSLKLVCTMSVGYDHIDLKAAQRLSIPVCYVPSVQNDAVADHVLALLLASARRVVEADQICRSSETKKMYPFYLFMALPVSRATVGIIGMGRIGMEVAKRTAGFGMKLIYHNRNRKSKEEEDMVGATYMSSLIGLLKESDYIVLLAAGYQENYHMIGKEEFAMMKKTAVFINVSRGFMVDQDALVDALKENRISHAGLDATDPEPLPRDHPLLSLSNVTLTPHCAGAVLAVRLEQCRVVIGNILACIEGKPLVHQIE